MARKTKQQPPTLEELADRLEAEIDAALGVSVLVVRTDGKVTRVSDEEAQGLRDRGRGGEIERVWLKDPDHSGIMKVIDQCPQDLQDAFDEKLRRLIRSNPAIVLPAIKQMRRVAGDQTAAKSDRESAQEFLKRHGFDDESLADDE